MKRLILLFLIINIFGRFASAQDVFYNQLADSAYLLTKQKVVYNPDYFTITYPGGDIPKGYGVCTDVVIRAYRKFGIDLQKEVHEDMKDNFNLYPKKWGLSKPDKNIDHRRVPNLMKFFSRYGTILTTSKDVNAFKPGDIVCWDLGGGVTHIGLVSNRRAPNENHYLIIHNIGRGQVIEDCLFNFQIIGHYRYKK